MTVETRREGLSWLQKARRLSPSLARIDFDIGKAQFDLTDFPAAASSFEAALEEQQQRRSGGVLPCGSLGHFK